MNMLLMQNERSANDFSTFGLRVKATLRMVRVVIEADGSIRILAVFRLVTQRSAAPSRFVPTDNPPNQPPLPFEMAMSIGDPPPANGIVRAAFLLFESCAASLLLPFLHIARATICADKFQAAFVKFRINQTRTRSTCNPNPNRVHVDKS